MNNLSHKQSNSNICGTLLPAVRRCRIQQFMRSVFLLPIVTLLSLRMPAAPFTIHLFPGASSFILYLTAAWNIEFILFRWKTTSLYFSVNFNIRYCSASYYNLFLTWCLLVLLANFLKHPTPQVVSLLFKNPMLNCSGQHILYLKTFLCLLTPSLNTGALNIWREMQ